LTVYKYGATEPMPESENKGGTLWSIMNTHTRI
jgi:hypothetical protein